MKETSESVIYKEHVFKKSMLVKKSFMIINILCSDLNSERENNPLKQ